MARLNQSLSRRPHQHPKNTTPRRPSWTRRSSAPSQTSDGRGEPASKRSTASIPSNQQPEYPTPRPNPPPESGRNQRNHTRRCAFCPSAPPPTSCMSSCACAIRRPGTHRAVNVRPTSLHFSSLALLVGERRGARARRGPPRRRIIRRHPARRRPPTRRRGPHRVTRRGGREAGAARPSQSELIFRRSRSAEPLERLAPLVRGLACHPDASHQ